MDRAEGSLIAIIAALIGAVFLVVGALNSFFPAILIGAAIMIIAGILLLVLWLNPRNDSTS